MTAAARKRREETAPVPMTEEELAKAIAASHLVVPMPLTQGDVDRFWETRGGADKRFYRRRAREIVRVLSLPAGKAGTYMPSRRRREEG